MRTELDRFLEDRDNRRLFEEERLILEVTEAICALMNEQGFSRAQLAERLGCTPANVSQILDGENNFTVRTIADFLFELDARMVVTTEPLTTAIPSAFLRDAHETYPARANQPHWVYPPTMSAGTPIVGAPASPHPRERSPLAA
jgi:transcriptional regulator with XRE-family HTH domain